MSQVNARPKIQLRHKETTPEDGPQWTRLSKALNSISNLSVIPETAATINQEEAESFDFIFLDISIADLNGLMEQPLSNVVLVKEHAFPWNSVQSDSRMLEVFQHYPCLLLESMSTNELIRLLYQFLTPKRQAGLTTIMEKNSIILAEKLQGIENIGATTDKVSSYLEQLENFELKDKIASIRQLLPSLLLEAFDQIKNTQTPYPAIDFQISASAKKMAVNMRFSYQKDPNRILKETLSGESLNWFLAWQHSDILLLTHHAQYQELEVHIILSESGNQPFGAFRTVLFRELQKSPAKNSLLTAPESYKFQIISDIKTNAATHALAYQEKMDSSSLINEIDIESLPEEVAKKISDLESQSSYLSGHLAKKENQIKESTKKLANLTKELSKKRGEILNLTKIADVQKDSFQKKISDLEAKLKKLNISNKTAAEESEKLQANNSSEALTKVESVLRATENEKKHLNERLANEQKRISLIEQKYASLYKDLTTKEKELQHFKNIVTKLKKEKTSQETSTQQSTASANQPELAAKVKEYELREQALKQELKKVYFKIETQEKNVKAIQQDAVEKSKLLEQKLQAAKAKELELLKRVDELSTALKRAVKAA